MKPLARIRELPEEVLFFARLAAYGLIVGVGYWFLTYEPVGSVLLTAMGAASAVLTLLLLRGRRRKVDAVGSADGPFGDDRGRIPSPTFAPLEVGVGIGIASLSFAFGGWMAIAAVLPIVSGATSWIRGALREYAATEADDRGLSRGGPPSGAPPAA